MTNPDERDSLLRKNLKVMQIIAGALFLGVMGFTTIVLVLVATGSIVPGGAPAGNPPIISFVAVLIWGVQAPLAILLPGLQTRNGLKTIVSRNWPASRGANPASFSTDANKLLALRQTTLITSLALLEGAAFFAGVSYLLEGRVFVLAVVVVALLQMLMNFPTEYRVRTWLETELDQLALLRQQA
jgi:hypothetical protein